MADFLMTLTPAEAFALVMVCSLFIAPYTRRPRYHDAPPPCDVAEGEAALHQLLRPTMGDYDPMHPQFIAGFKLGHAAGRKRGAALPPPPGGSHG